MSRKKEIEIREEDIKFIHGGEYGIFKEKILTNCYCSRCFNTTIVNYSIFLNVLNDLILKGFCKKCGNHVNRYVETGEVEEYQERIEKVRKRYYLN